MPYFFCVKCKTWIWYNSEIGIENMLCGCGINHNLSFKGYNAVPIPTDELFDVLIHYNLKKK